MNISGLRCGTESATVILIQFFSWYPITVLIISTICLLIIYLNIGTARIISIVRAWYTRIFVHSAWKFFTNLERGCALFFIIRHIWIGASELTSVQMKPVMSGGSWSNCKLGLKDGTNGQITHAAVYRQVNRAYKTKNQLTLVTTIFCYVY